MAEARRPGRKLLPLSVVGTGTKVAVLYSPRKEWILDIEFEGRVKF